MSGVLLVHRCTLGVLECVWVVCVHGCGLGLKTFASTRVRSGCELCVFDNCIHFVANRCNRKIKSNGALSFFVHAAACKRSRRTSPRGTWCFWFRGQAPQISKGGERA